MAIGRAIFIAAGFSLLSTLPLAAQGLLDLHDKRYEGNKLCLSSHFHDGNSTGEKSKKAAELAAIRVWQDFTSWEYGAAWGSFRNAGSKSVKCDQPGGNWGCHVQARPCSLRQRRR